MSAHVRLHRRRGGRQRHWIGGLLSLLLLLALVPHQSAATEEADDGSSPSSKQAHQSLLEEGRFPSATTCRSCHPVHYQQWSASPHANAFETLEAKHSTGNADCQKCHTTGFEKSGGFPAGGPTLQGVGCESCHGPGGPHLQEGSTKRGSILALADKCDSCVILQICGSCHDEQNDPGFEFKVLDKIDLIRHAMGSQESAGP